MTLEPYSITSYNPQPINKLIEQYQNVASQQYAANLTRQKQAEDIYDRIIAMYGAGGAYGAAAEVLLGRQKVSDVGRTIQRDISRGLYGIRPYEEEWERGVGAEARLKLEDIKTERLSAALAGKAGFLERIEQPYPDYGALQQAMAAQTSKPSPFIIPSITGTAGTSDSLWSKDVLKMPTGGAYTGMPTTPESYYGPTQIATGKRVAEQGGAATTTPITMAGGYGPAFQTKEEMAKISGGTAPTGLRYAPEVGYGFGVAPVPTQPQPAGTVPTISQWLEMHGLNPKLTPKDVSPTEWKKVEARSKQLQQQWASLYMKKK